MYYDVRSKARDGGFFPKRKVELLLKLLSGNKEKSETLHKVPDDPLRTIDKEEAETLDKGMQDESVR